MCNINIPGVFPVSGYLLVGSSPRRGRADLVIPLLLLLFVHPIVE